ncbi:MAG: type I restriction-modification system endonuclease, partial [Polyangia bacterium]
AIAEWPTENGPADYILFVGLTPVATVEAKRKNKDVSGCIQQAKRYSRGFVIDGTLTSPGGPWLQHKLPFVFSTNGRPYLRQLETRSGIWFCDVRLPDRLGHALDGWYTPEGLTALLKRDEVRAHQQLSQEPFAYGFTLRPYQQTAIQAVESAIAKGQRAILLAMATGTGKTKTCIALIYRLLKVQRFRRILFLVDRAALGEQAANAFKDTRMEGLQTFAETFGIKEFDEAEPESATVVHVATVQGMVKRILYCRDSDIPPAVVQYDCIIVDECHRGYLLDRELSDAEMVFRSHEDYISKYRRVLDYFDAVKVGLTATPALHTSEIFGAPVFHYTYREAVIDGFLVDHEPPVQIHTDLSQNGIVWAAGERVAVYHTRRNEVSLYTTPDEIKLEVEDFNRKVITEPWNRVVCEFLAREIDPSSRQKTLIFCANDAHADLVVKRLKLAFEARYGAVEDDAVIKITGAADKPLQLIRRYKNERQPSVAVTVDLLTTGVDVPEICNLVFLRRVNSRILFDQMLGRATRLCDKIGKATFRIFDAVRIYEALQPVTAMQPVVVDPTTRFVDLARITKGQKRGPSAQVRSVPYLRVANVQRGRLDLTSIKEIEATEEEIYELRLIQGDLLCTEGGDRDKLGRGWVWNDEIPECIHQNHIFRARLGSQGLNAKYVSWYCNQVGAEYFLSQAKQTTNLASINITKLGQLPIALAPVNEQKRIADKLNSLLARVDACRERLDRVPGILKRFRQAVLAAATSGELTREWREANGCAGSSNDSRTSLPPGWSRCAVGRFAECLDRLRVPIKKDNRKNLRGLYPYYGANGEVGRLDEYIFDDELVLVTEDETFYGREKPIAYRSSGKCWVNNHAHVLRAQDVVSTDYLCYSLMYYNVEPWLSGTTGRAKLTQKALIGIAYQYTAQE